jgi:CheY-like chemotaxis protein/HPt (histidine-containing phosphotransfer) domain-containing protein
VALVDVQMPEIDGIMLARAIRADPLISGTRLIVLTSLGQALSPAEMKELGLDAYLVKPIKKARLYDCLARVVGNAPIEEAATKVVSQDKTSIFPESDPHKVRILVAEDNSTNQKVALAQLRKLGCGANAVASGLEVLEALERINYDIILMDCQMPEMDGYEATRAIRKREQDPDRPCPWKLPVYIIAMTAHTMQGDREKCLAAGMDDYLGKPVREAELRAALEHWKLATQRRTEQSPADELASEPGAAPARVNRLAEPAAAPVDLSRLKEVTDGDPALLVEMVELYLQESADFVRKLGAAIQNGTAKEVERLAHTYAGASVSCGMTAVVSALRDLECMGRSGQLQGAGHAYAEVRSGLNRIREFLAPICEEKSTHDRSPTEV